MKTPRIRDFDPNAAPKLGSPMDNLPSIAPKGARSAMPEEELERTQPRTRNRSQKPSTRTPVRPYVRSLARIPFEIYKDQHDALKQFSLEAQTRGEKGSMSQMVREALDAYINKRRDAD